MTTTDAALSAPLLDALFSRAHAFLETDADRAKLPLYKFGAKAENPRLFGLALEEAEYSVRLGNIPSGVYLIRVSTKQGEILTQKFIKGGWMYIFQSNTNVCNFMQHDGKDLVKGTKCLTMFVPHSSEFKVILLLHNVW